MSNPLVIRLAAIWADPRRLAQACIGLFAILAIPIMYSSTPGLITLDWQRMYRLEDFKTWGDLGTFLSELQTAISPLWATMEIISYKLTGSTWIFSKLAYVLSPTISFVLGMRLIGADRIRILAFTGLSLVYVLAIRVIHKGNPQLYDIYTPLLCLAYLAALHHARQAAKGHTAALGAGLFLAMLELTRTFVFPIFPIILPLSILALRLKGRKAILLFLVPVLILSGGWHAKQFIAHDQLHWSNHTGYNLQKTWVDFLPEKFQDPQYPPRYPGGFPDINCDAHTAHNKVMTKAIGQAIMQQPGKATMRVVEGTLNLYKPHTRMYLGVLSGPPAMVYRIAVWIPALSLFIGMIFFGVSLVRNIRKRSAWLALTEPENILMITLLLWSILIGASERGEEARFMISLLPLLAVMPGWTHHLGPALRRWINK